MHDSEPRHRESGSPQPPRRGVISALRRTAVRPSLPLAIACLLIPASQALGAAAHGRSAAPSGHSKLPHEATAEWEQGTVQFTCTGVTWNYRGFPEAEGNRVAEAIFVDHSEVSAALAVFNGVTGSHTTALMQTPGRHLFKVHARWHTNGLAGHFSAHAKINCPVAPSFSVEDLQAVAGGGGYSSSAISAQVGQTVDSQIVVHNTGNVALTLSGLSNARCDAGTITVPANPLPAGASTAYLCSHLVTAADGAAGSYSSAATVLAVPPEGDGEAIKHTANTLTVKVAAGAVQSAAPATSSKTTTTPTSSATPKSGLLGYSSPTVPALAGPRACVRGAFHVSVKAAGVRSVTFYLDGHKLRTLTSKDARGGRLTISINPARLSMRRHTLLARLALAPTATSASARASRTLVISRCVTSTKG